MSDKVYTVQDYKSGQPRWCPGCGDHAFLNSLHKAMAEQVMETYKAEKSARYTELKNKFYS